MTCCKQVIVLAFQSLTGRLQTSKAHRSASLRAVFQSLTGRLQTVRHEAALQLGYLFQSLTGRLQTRPLSRLRISNSGFNPSQVGYKREVALRKMQGKTRFNPSQVGYKQDTLFARFKKSARFQSLTGRLQTGLFRK